MLAQMAPGPLVHVYVQPCGQSWMNTMKSFGQYNMTLVVHSSTHTYWDLWIVQGQRAVCVRTNLVNMRKMTCRQCSVIDTWSLPTMACIHWS